MTVVMRFGEKTIADFTSCWLMRSPLLVHNAYFLLNQLATHASVFVSVLLYTRSSVAALPAALPASLLWSGAGALFAAWALTYVARARERERSSFAHA
jgi:hypothetical protein